jgi:hypothetical protein
VQPAIPCVQTINEPFHPIHHVIPFHHSSSSISTTTFPIKRSINSDTANRGEAIPEWFDYLRVQAIRKFKFQKKSISNKSRCTISLWLASTVVSIKRTLPGLVVAV